MLVWKVSVMQQKILVLLLYNKICFYFSSNVSPRAVSKVPGFVALRENLENQGKFEKSVKPWEISLGNFLENRETQGNS